MRYEIDLVGPDKRDFYEARGLFDRGEFEQALTDGEALLAKHGDNMWVLSLVGETLLKLDRYGLAYNVYKHLTSIEPNIWVFWNNLGRCYEEMIRFDEAVLCFKRALRLSPGEFPPLRNMLLTAIYQCRWDDAREFAKRAVEAATKPEQLRQIDSDMAPVYMTCGEWSEGWRCYELQLGDKYRRDKPYRDEPRWDGSPGKTVVIYGEQGIGDEVMFASMYPEALRDCEAILECDRRLHGLFKRSFPAARAVYDTRHDAALYWPGKETFDARCAAGSLGRIYRNTREAFVRSTERIRVAPYLQADPVRRAGYRAILDSFPGRKIGIAWTGGQWNTRQRDRSVSLRQLAPILAEKGNTLISLQYRSAKAEVEELEQETGLKVHHWAWATETRDYDDTAALVSELDAVVSVTTAVALLAGAVGTPCHVMVPERPTWHWGIEGPMPWLPLNLYRRKGDDWTPIINQIAEAL